MFPTITFFCELPSTELVDLFNQPGLVKQLQSMQAGVSLGLLDLSAERAEVVQRLNAANIPVTAWLLLDKADGYWFNLDNAPKAVHFYQLFKEWSTRYGLQWAAIGLDIEPDLGLMQKTTRDGWRALQELIKRMRSSVRRSSVQEYSSLVTRMHLDGFLVESYQFPLIVDERRAGSKVVQNVTGIVDLPTDREVLMLYSSFMRPIGDGILLGYGRQAGGVGIGSTGGGVVVEGTVDPTPLTWAELEHDLRLAYQLNDHLYIFSLEGCVMHGYLEKIAAMDWFAPEIASETQRRKVQTARTLGTGLLWLLARPWVLVLGALGLACLFRCGKKKRKCHCGCEKSCC